MTRSVEATGRNIEQAIENALFELKAPREDVDIKIISEGGLFKKAKVVVSISEDAIEKYEKREKERKKESLKKIEDDDDDDDDDDKDDDKDDDDDDDKDDDKDEDDDDDDYKKEKKEREKLEKKAKKEKEKQEKKEEKICSDEKRERPSCTEFVKGLVEAFGKSAEITEIEDEDVKKIILDGEDLGELIGYRGEALFALSYLMSTICKREDKRVLLDICGYREKREDSLRKLAYRMAAKVAKTGRYARLEPMDASERRIIHLALQDNDKVTTMSKGTEPKRYLIIFPREYKD